MKYSSVLLLLTLAFVSASKNKNDAKSEKGNKEYVISYNVIDAINHINSRQT